MDEPLGPQVVARSNGQGSGSSIGDREKVSTKCKLFRSLQSRLVKHLLDAPASEMERPAKCSAQPIPIGEEGLRSGVQQRNKAKVFSVFRRNA